MARQFDAIVFDYGNTLVPFGPAEIAGCDAALVNRLRELLGDIDAEVVRVVRDRNRMAPYLGDPPAWRENDMTAIAIELVRELIGRDPTEAERNAILQVRHDAFVASIHLPDGIREMLVRLRRRHKVALLSNYPGSPAIHESLRKVGLADCFDAVVISADLGHVKPHPLLFETVLDAVQVDAAYALMVGDNWLADVQGGKRAGMSAAWITQYEPPESVARRGAGMEPDVILSRTMDLEAWLAM